MTQPRIITSPELKIGSEGSCGHELLLTHDLKLNPGSRGLVDTGVKIKEIPENIFGKIMPKSSHAINGIDILGGVIDPDYRGNIKVIVINHSSKLFELKAGKSIAQLVFLPFFLSTNCILPNTKNEHTGFGSTGM